VARVTRTVERQHGAAAAQGVTLSASVMQRVTDNGNGPGPSADPVAHWRTVERIRDEAGRELVPEADDLALKLAEHDHPTERLRVLLSNWFDSHSTDGEDTGEEIDVQVGRAIEQVDPDTFEGKALGRLIAGSARAGRPVGEPPVPALGRVVALLAQLVEAAALGRSLIEEDADDLSSMVSAGAINPSTAASGLAMFDRGLDNTRADAAIAAIFDEEPLDVLGAALRIGVGFLGLWQALGFPADNVDERRRVVAAMTGTVVLMAKGIATEGGMTMPEAVARTGAALAAAGPSRAAAYREAAGPSLASPDEET
jgi:hypothetical protein